jgi:serine/threonine protein kinase
MSYCLNPVCSSPQNLDEAIVCQCGAKVWLNDCYLPLRAIGQGGFGRTFLAVDATKPLKPLCVIKQFFPQALGTDSRDKAAELFRQEALRLKELGSHAQIPNLLEFLEQEGQQYLIQEFIDGRNLEQELAEQGRFSAAQIRQLLNDLLPVLQFIHDRQVIHRDIKPANIIRRSADQKLVLVDLGAAKYATGTALAKTGTVIGSAEFTAPEQTRGKAVFASDLYSLGATCIHLLTQLSPFDLFDSSDDRWVWRDYLSHPVSQSLGQILDKMLQSGTKRRYQSAEQVLQDLNPTTQTDPKIVSPVAKKPKTQKSSPDQHLDPRDELIAAFELETRSRRLDIVDGKARTVPIYPDLKSERVGKIARAAPDRRSALVKPRSREMARVKSVLILTLILLSPLILTLTLLSPLGIEILKGNRSPNTAPVQAPPVQTSP